MTILVLFLLSFVPINEYLPSGAGKSEAVFRRGNRWLIVTNMEYVCMVILLEHS